MKLALDSLEGQHLMDATLALEGLQRCLDAHKTAVIGRLDTNDTTYREVGLATKTWKANRCHVPPGSVARELMVARTLTRFEGFAGALAAGQISVEHVVALANASNPRVIDMLIVEIQDSLDRVRVTQQVQRTTSPTSAASSPCWMRTAPSQTTGTTTPPGWRPTAPPTCTS
ncbi:MAG: hypothetical protein R2789_13760 [Microthrixaceae bacterium]